MALIGIDEVGRGSWAGPLLVVAALPVGLLPNGLTDSKKLRRAKREQLAMQLANVCKFGEGWVWPDEIDSLGLGQAMRTGVSRALAQLNALASDEVIIDGPVNYCAPDQFPLAKAVIRADYLHPVVSAASVYAKVKRDAYMAAAHRRLPSYGFDKHVGYGTAYHRRQLTAFGPSKLHRQSFRPVRQAMEARIAL